MKNARAQILEVVKALLREFNSYVKPSMFTSDVPEPYEALKRGDITDRQRLVQLLNNNDLLRISATDILLGRREVIGQGTFDDGIFRQFSCPKYPNRCKLWLVAFKTTP